jgi:hypothetical protein
MVAELPDQADGRKNRALAVLFQRIELHNVFALPPIRPIRPIRHDPVAPLHWSQPKRLLKKLFHGPARGALIGGRSRSVQSAASALRFV